MPLDSHECCCATMIRTLSTFSLSYPGPVNWTGWSIARLYQRNQIQNAILSPTLTFVFQLQFQPPSASALGGLWSFIWVGPDPCWRHWSTEERGQTWCRPGKFAWHWGIRICMSCSTYHSKIVNEANEHVLKLTHQTLHGFHRDLKKMRLATNKWWKCCAAIFHLDCREHGNSRTTKGKYLLAEPRNNST